MKIVRTIASALREFETKRFKGMTDKERYALRKAIGLCVRCGIKFADHGVMCESCAEIKSQQKAKYAATHKAQHRKAMAIYRKKKKADGLCAECGTRPTIGGKLLCPRCQKQHSLNVAFWRKKKALQEAEA